MKSRTAFIVLLALLLTAVGLVWLIDPWSTTGSGLPALLPQEPDKVTEVHVISDFDTLVFHRSDSLWMMEGEEMNPGVVENLVYASSRLSMRSILPADEVSVNGPAVEVVFRKGNREAGHFFFAASTSGYVAFAPGADQYFGVELPGYAGLSLEKVFSGNADHYRMHLLADLLPSEIASVEVQPWNGTAFVALQDSLYNISVLLAESGKDVTGDGVTGDGVTGEDVAGDGVTGDGVTGEDVTGEDVTGEDVTGEDVTAEVDEHKIRLLFSYFNAIRYDRVAGPAEVDTGNLPAEVDQGSISAEVDAGNLPAEVDQGSISAEVDAGNLPAEVDQGSISAEVDAGSMDEEVDTEILPSVPWASVAVTTFDGVRRQFDVYQWVKPGEEHPDLFEALVVYNGRPRLLVVNYYYLDLLVRGLEDYR